MAAPFSYVGEASSQYEKGTFYRTVKDIGQSTGQKHSGREEVQGTHRNGVGLAEIGVKLQGEIPERIEGMAGIESLLILSVAAFNLAVVSGRIRPDKRMPLPNSTNVASNSVGWFCNERLKRLVNSEPLSVWTHLIKKPCFVKNAEALFTKHADE